MVPSYPIYTRSTQCDKRQWLGQIFIMSAINFLLLQNPNVHYCHHESPPFDPTLKQPNVALQYVIIHYFQNVFKSRTGDPATYLILVQHQCPINYSSEPTIMFNNTLYRTRNFILIITILGTEQYNRTFLLITRKYLFKQVQNIVNVNFFITYFESTNSNISK